MTPNGFVSFLDLHGIPLCLYANHNGFWSCIAFPVLWLGPMGYAWFSLSQGFWWFVRNLSPQPAWKNNSHRIRHCQILFLIKYFLPLIAVRIFASDLVLVPDFIDFGPSEIIIISADQLMKMKMRIAVDFDYDSQWFWATFSDFHGITFPFICKT